MELTDELLFRTYTAKEFVSLVESVPEWEVASLYDFHYNVDGPITLAPWTEDVVAVLRRR